MAFTFHPRTVYSFDVYPVPIIGNGFKRVTVQSVLDYDTALGFDDVETRHQNVYAFLPEGTPNNPRFFDYLLIRTEDNIQTIIAVPWIKEDTIVVVKSLKIEAIIEDIDSAAELELIRACLSQNGYNKFSLRLLDDTTPQIS